MPDYPRLKDQIDAALIDQIAGRFAALHPAFDRAGFAAAVMAQLDSLELKARCHFIAETMRRFLPADVAAALNIVVESLDEARHGFAPIDNAGLRLMAFPAFVEKYGPKDPDAALDAMPPITRVSSCEFAIRPLLMRHRESTLKRLRQWAVADDEHVRRLVSEGSRPRLPWAPQLTDFIADPTPTLALLETLKDDPSLYVRRSVANHLNDISKDHPQLVLHTARAWKTDASDERLWLIRHALRTLVKRGDTQALAILGFETPQVALRKLTLEPTALQYGGELTFSFELRSQCGAAQQLMIDFALHFVKANGKTAPKVFKLRQATLPANETISVSKRFAIRPISTRKHYPGRHRLEIQVNGQIVGGADFELLMQTRT